MAKNIYPTITPQYDIELLTLGSGDFKGKPEEFPEYMKEVLVRIKTAVPPERGEKWLADSYVFWKKFMDKPLKAIGVCACRLSFVHINEYVQA